VEGKGENVKEIFVNGKACPGEGNSVTLDYESLPDKAEILFTRF
jgi:hypothetical protein